MKHKIYVGGVWGFGNISIMQQFRDDCEVEFLENDFEYALKVAKIWKNIHRRIGGNIVGKLFRRLLSLRIWDSKYALTHCDFENNDVNYVVIFNSALLHYYSKEYFLRLKKRYHIKLILYIIDPMPDGLWSEIQAVQEVFDMILTMHPYNCRKYGFPYLPYIYAKPKMNGNYGEVKETNLFYCGVANVYREKVIREIMLQCEERDIPFDFWLKPFDNAAIEDVNVHYSEMPYEENVWRILHSKCILEIMHEGYEGITQRYLEAIVYNKKLLTNNAEIKSLPYYSPKYMQYFHDVEDIDWQWFMDDTEVDYSYQGDFSPEAWKNRLLQLVG